MLAPLGSAPKQPVGTERRALLGSSCFAVEGKVQALAVAGASHWGRAVGAGRSSSSAPQRPELRRMAHARAVTVRRSLIWSGSYLRSIGIACSETAGLLWRGFRASTCVAPVRAARAGRRAARRPRSCTAVFPARVNISALTLKNDVRVHREPWHKTHPIEVRAIQSDLDAVRDGPTVFRGRTGSTLCRCVNPATQSRAGTTTALMSERRTACPTVLAG